MISKSELQDNTKISTFEEYQKKYFPAAFDISELDFDSPEEFAIHIAENAFEKIGKKIHMIECQ